MIMQETRGFRNNNPLNIKFSAKNSWLGKVFENKKDKVFEEFTDIKYGLRATIRLIRRYIKGGINTPRKIIDRWCPPVDENNGTNESYHKYVNAVMAAHFVPYNENTPIDIADYPRIFQLTSAMSWFESNYVIDEEVFREAWLLAVRK